MSFTWKRPEGRIMSPEDMMRLIIRVADELGMPDRRGACIIAGMTVKQESDFWRPGNNADPCFRADPGRFLHDSMGDDGRSVGPYQQQTSGPPPARPWGWGGLYGDPEGTRKRMDPYESTKLFLAALKKRPYRAGNAKEANDWAQDVQDSGVPDAYAKHWDAINKLYDSVKGGAPPAPPPPPPPPAAVVPYGLPRGSNSGGYGGNGVRFPDWVYQLGNAFGVKPSTYPGHQETNRNETGYAPNPQNLNRGIDWAAPGAPDEIDRLTRFADYLATIPHFLEQVIWQNPRTMRSIEVAGGRHQPGYFTANLPEHRNHVHTRQSRSVPAPGTPAPPAPAPAGRPFGAHRRGNALWLADALRAEGLKVVEYPGWRERSNGNNFDEIVGVIMHHTGSNNATAASIANGRPDLRGPLSQLHIARDGTVTVVAAGCANHAGTGALPWLPKHTGNRRTIGIEAANDGGGSPGKPHRSSWPDVQYDAYIRTVKVVLWETGWGADHVASHQEYDRGDPPTFEGKWDPGALDMPTVRRAVDAALKLPPTQGEDDLSAEAERMIRELHTAFLEPTESLSVLKKPGEGKIAPLVRFLRYIDANTHAPFMRMLAELGHPDALRDLNTLADVDLSRYPECAAGRDLATAILADVEGTKPAQPAVVATAAAPAVASYSDTETTRLYEENARLQAENARLQAEAAVRAVDAAVGTTEVAASVPAVIEPEKTSMGEIVKGIVDAVERLDLAGALDVNDRATLAGSIKVLEMKNGSQL